MILGHRCETGTCRCRDCGVDSRAAGTFRQVERHAATRQIELSFAETEDAVRAEPRQGSIRESKLPRESLPVRTAVPGWTLLLTEAGRGAAFGASNCTS